MTDFLNISPAKHTDLAPVQESFVMHMHSSYEIFCFLSGDAKYVVEGTVYPLRRGDIILIRRSESHRLLLLSNTKYTRMTVNFIPADPHSDFTAELLLPFNARPLGTLNHYPSSLFSNIGVLHYIEQICLCDNEQLRNAYLTVFLKEISKKFKEIQQSSATAELNICSDIIQYINSNITEPLSLQLLSNHFFISKSQINRNFKQAIGSTVWEYIVEKRLLLAKEQIENGGSPTKVYIDCGFGDYTAFYRAYRSRFGASPSKTELIRHTD